MCQIIVVIGMNKECFDLIKTKNISSATKKKIQSIIKFNKSIFKFGRLIEYYLKTTICHLFFAESIL